jgi:hypothetical protein
MEGVTGEEFFDLSELQRFLSHRGPPMRHCNTKVTLAHLFVKAELISRNRIRPSDTFPVTQKTDMSDHKSALTLVWVPALPILSLFKLLLG